MMNDEGFYSRRDSNKEHATCTRAAGKHRETPQTERPPLNPQESNHNECGRGTSPKLPGQSACCRTQRRQDHVGPCNKQIGEERKNMTMYPYCSLRLHPDLRIRKHITSMCQAGLHLQATGPRKTARKSTYWVPRQGVASPTRSNLVTMDATLLCDLLILSTTAVFLQSAPACCSI
jgi:hypothetical protein